MTEIGTYCVCHRCRKTPILIYHPSLPFSKTSRFPSTLSSSKLSKNARSEDKMDRFSEEEESIDEKFK